MNFRYEKEKEVITRVERSSYKPLKEITNSFRKFLVLYFVTCNSMFCCLVFSLQAVKLARQLLEEDEEDEEGTRDGPSEVATASTEDVVDEEASQDTANGENV